MAFSGNTFGWQVPPIMITAICTENEGELCHPKLAWRLRVLGNFRLGFTPIRKLKVKSFAKQRNMNGPRQIAKPAAFERCVVMGGIAVSPRIPPSNANE